MARILIPCDSVIVSIGINNVIRFVRFNLPRRQFRVGRLGLRRPRLWQLRLRQLRLRQLRGDALGGSLWVTRCNHHVTVIPIKLPNLTPIRNITGYTARSAHKTKAVNRTKADHPGSAAGGRRERCHALTIHRCNVLLENPATPASLSGISRVLRGRTKDPPARPPGTRSLSRSSGGYIAHELCDLHRDVHHVAYHHDRGRPHPFLCDTAFHMFQC
jgi:hypothetical protein